MRLGVPLTASGTITLRDGYQTYAGYGSGLNSEFTQGNTGGMAASTGMDIGHLGNITLEVADDPSFTLPEGMTTLVSNGGVVRAGESVTVTIPICPWICCGASTITARTTNSSARTPSSTPRSPA